MANRKDPSRPCPDYRELKWKEQNGCCDLCGLPLNEKYSTLDHDHKTEKARGILHQGCNSKLVGIEDKIFLQQALTYLDKYK